MGSNPTLSARLKPQFFEPLFGFPLWPLLLARILGIAMLRKTNHCEPFWEFIVIRSKNATQPLKLPSSAALRAQNQTRE
ncbi:MAG: hypothetical protein ABW032_04600 [Burkholderiaceae bacterium]